jgi:leader peptidase (prepilin peptidase)/N-methyltransferase
MNEPLLNLSHLLPSLFSAVMAGNITITLAAMCIGVVIGSFLNVLIVRFPIMMQRAWDNDLAQATHAPIPHTTPYNLCWPASACPHCHHPLAHWHKLPVVSYLLLRGRCAYCAQAISWRYPCVELFSGAIAAWIVWHNGTGAYSLYTLLFVYMMLVLACIDARTQLLPDQLSLSLLWLGLIANLNATFVPLHDAVIGAILGYVFLWGVYCLYKGITGKEGMGYGDFKLLAAIGAWCGWQQLPMVIFIAAFCGMIVGFTLIACKKMRNDEAMPFGPFLAIAGVFTLIYGDTVLPLFYRLFEPV